jgi:hypothetical protein
LWFGGGQHGKTQKKACQVILNLDGELVCSSFDHYHLLIRAENKLPYGNLHVAAGFSLRKLKLAATF